jgi:hypothetical protein
MKPQNPIKNSQKIRYADAQNHNAKKITVNVFKGERHVAVNANAKIVKIHQVTQLMTIYDYYFLLVLSQSYIPTFSMDI